MLTIFVFQCKGIHVMVVKHFNDIMEFLIDHIEADWHIYAPVN